MSKDWIEAFELVHKGQQPNFGKLLRGYGSGVDAPLSEVYREILLQYPHVKVSFKLGLSSNLKLTLLRGKVVLTHRPVDAWISSLHKTIFKVKSKVYGALIYLVPAVSKAPASIASLRLRSCCRCTGNDASQSSSSNAGTSTARSRR